MSYQILQGARLPIKVWIDDLKKAESGALDQLRATANLPWVRDVAAMPDLHVGKGAVVGSVILSEGALSPSVIGVDIGCFPAGTKVACVDGDRSIEDLVGQEDLVVLAFDQQSKQIVPARATALKTRNAAPLVQVNLDEGSFVCTPEHKIMLRDGTYCEAKDLSSGARLMPLRTDLDKDGYLYIKQPYFPEYKKRFPLTFVHRMVAEAFLSKPEGTVVHHRDENKTNNHPSNLECISASEHSTLHAEDHWHWQNEDFERKRIQALGEKAKTEDGHAFYAERGTKNILRYMADRAAHFKEAVKHNGQRGKSFLQKFNDDPATREKVRALKSHVCVFCGEKIKSDSFQGYHYQRKHRLQVKQYLQQQNHKVVSVQLLERQEDVFCLQVPGHNNFALSCGVFVHNCGMIAVKTTLSPKKFEKPRFLQGLRAEIEQVIPTGYNGNTEISKRVLRSLEDLGPLSAFADNELPQKVKDKIVSNIGSLGSGNHFIEGCFDTDGTVWFMLHSGSRNIGKELAELHIRKAQGLMDETVRTYGGVQIPKELAPLLEGTPEYQNYLHDLLWAQRYARANRDEMMQRLLEVVTDYTLNDGRDPGSIVELRVDCHHNFLDSVEIDGRQCLLTRKGAVAARAGELAIIPGSMGTKSYIVKGKGNPHSYCSCSHGAGRKMSRGAAKERFTLADLQEQTKGVECRRDKAVLDEIPGAYKDIDKVMANQTDLVEPLYELKQFLCVKGD